MSGQPQKSRLSASLLFGLGLGALMLMVALLSRPTDEALAYGQGLGLSPLGAQAALIAGMTALTFVVTATARAIMFGRGGIWPSVVYGLVGAPIGFLFAFGFDAFGLLGPLAIGAGPFEVIVLGLGFIFVIVGALALLGTALSQFGASDMDMSRRDRAMTTPAAGVWVLEGVILVLLTLLHLRAGQGADPFSLTLLGLLTVCVLADVGLHALTWRAMDEFMRGAWGEAMGIGLVIALAVGFIYAGAQAIGFVPEAGIYHALTGFYGIYLVVSVIHTMVRTPEVFTSSPPEKTA